MAIGGSFKVGSSLTQYSNDVSKSFDKLSSGKRINKAQDDAAGLAVVAALESSVTTSIQGARNAVDGVSVAAIAGSALDQISEISGRQSELAQQAANGTISDDQRSSLNDEFQQLEQEKSRILSTTTFNGVNVFDGATIQAGNGSDANSQITIPKVDTSSLTISADISSQAAAQSTLDQIKNQADSLSAIQGQIGSSVNRLQVAESNSRSNAVESESAAARIRDVDVADETSKLVAARIRQQSDAALQGQASKLNSDTVLKLLS